MVINFLRYRLAAMFLSFIMFAGFTGLCIYRYINLGHIFTYSIDFTGGTQALLRFDRPVSAEYIAEILQSKGWQGAITRDFSDIEVLVRVKEFANDAKGLAHRIKEAIISVEPNYVITVEQSDAVGAGVGETLRTKSIYAVILALLAMLLYIAYCFWSLSYAVGAVCALFHDAVVMLFIFLLCDVEISVNIIASILAVLGYSINDTIVIFSQIRDGIAKKSNQSLAKVINASLNHTFKRTLLTSISTGLPILAMYFLGGPALHDFSFALLVGIVFGTYSSIYVATSVMMALYKEKS